MMVDYAMQSQQVPDAQQARSGSSGMRVSFN